MTEVLTYHFFRVQTEVEDEKLFFIPSHMRHYVMVKALV